MPPAPRAGLPREGGEQGFEERFAQPGGQEPDRLANGRLDEGGDVQPLVAVVAGGGGPLVGGRPNPAADRLQAEAVLVVSPDFDRPVGMGRPGARDRGAELLSNAARCSGAAAAEPARSGARAAGWRSGRSGAAGRPVRPGRTRCSASPMPPPSAERRPTPRPLRGRSGPRQQPDRLDVPRSGRAPRTARYRASSSSTGRCSTIRAMIPLPDHGRSTYQPRLDTGNHDIPTQSAGSRMTRKWPGRAPLRMRPVAGVQRRALHPASTLKGACGLRRRPTSAVAQTTKAINSLRGDRGGGDGIRTHGRG